MPFYAAGKRSIPETDVSVTISPTGDRYTTLLGTGRGCCYTHSYSDSYATHATGVLSQPVCTPHETRTMTNKGLMHAFLLALQCAEIKGQPSFASAALPTEVFMSAQRGEHQQVDLWLNKGGSPDAVC